MVGTKTAWGEIVKERLDAIKSVHGVVPPKELVNDARPDDSPIHDLFEWDDAIAGESWRVEQARQIIRTFRVVSEDGEVSTTPAFVHVTVERPDGTEVDGYEYLSTALATNHDQVIREAITQLEGWKRRFAAIEEFKPVVEAIDSLRL